MMRLFIFVMFASFWSTALYATGGGDVSSPLMDFVWKTFNVAVLVAIIYKFARKPVASALNSTAQSAKQVVDDARSAEEKITSELSGMRIQISVLEKDAVEMVASAKKDAENEKARIIEEGRQELVRMKEQARFTLEQERRKAEDDLRNWVAEESVKLAEGKLKKEMNQKHQAKLVKDYMNQLNQSEGAA
ncbi:MAG: ATP synthase F0 subunit B [SAR324 cluster bacterium]|nr:ATP synthase F0 subunit B [SAR324 cluster bacterium]